MTSPLPQKNQYKVSFLLKIGVAFFSHNLSKSHNRLVQVITVITGLTSGLFSPLSVAETISLESKFMEIMKYDQTIKSSNTEPNSLVWESGGDAFCSHSPTSQIANGFQFNDSNRWSRSASNAQLSQGDPMTLTWSFIPDGASQSAGFSCGVDGEIAGATSDLIAFLDGLHGSGPGGSDLSQRPWFSIFESAFNNWGTLNGINYVYEPNDDGATAGGGGAAGVLGLRGDLRIGGHLIDGENGPNVLACNFFANSGDMIIDTGNSSFYAPNLPENRGFRNVLEHEHGHGLSIEHVCPINQTKLMEPFISTAFLGAQEDDILAANRGYGDRDEFPSQNDTSNTATSLGTIAIDDSIIRTQVSIDGSSDQDFYSFVTPSNSLVSVTLTPTGSSYLDGAQNSNGSCSAGTNFNSLIENNLGIELRNQSGTSTLAAANSSSAGNPEQITNVSLNQGAGRYFVRVFGSQNKAQMYDLTIALTQNDTPEPSADTCSNFILKTVNGKAAVICL